MRKVALEWSLERQPAGEECEKGAAKTQSAFTMGERNCHVRKIEPAKVKDERNMKELEKVY